MFLIFMSVVSIFLLISSISLNFQIFEKFNKISIKIRSSNIRLLVNKNYEEGSKILAKSDFFILLWCLFFIIIKLYFYDIITIKINILISIFLILSVFISNYIILKQLKNL